MTKNLISVLLITSIFCTSLVNPLTASVARGADPEFAGLGEAAPTATSAEDPHPLDELPILGARLLAMFQKYAAYKKAAQSAGTSDLVTQARATGNLQAVLEAQQDVSVFQLVEEQSDWRRAEESLLDQASRLDNGGTYLDRFLRLPFVAPIVAAAISGASQSYVDGLGWMVDQTMKASSPHWNTLVSACVAEYITHPEEREVIQDYLSLLAQMNKKRIRATYGLDPWIAYLSVGTMVAYTGLVVVDFRAAWKSDPSRGEQLVVALREGREGLLKRMRDWRILQEDLERAYKSSRSKVRILRAALPDLRFQLRSSGSAESAKDLESAAADIGSELARIEERKAAREAIGRRVRDAWSRMLDEAWRLSKAALIGAPAGAAIGFEEESQLPPIDPKMALAFGEMKSVQKVASDVRDLEHRIALFQGDLEAGKLRRSVALARLKELVQGKSGTVDLSDQTVLLLKSEGGRIFDAGQAWPDLDKQRDALHKLNWFENRRLPLDQRLTQAFDQSDTLLKVVHEIDAQSLRDAESEGHGHVEPTLGLAPTAARLEALSTKLIGLARLYEILPTR